MLQSHKCSDLFERTPALNDWKICMISIKLGWIMTTDLNYELYGQFLNKCWKKEHDSIIHMRRWSYNKRAATISVRSTNLLENYNWSLQPLIWSVNTSGSKMSQVGTEESLRGYNSRWPNVRLPENKLLQLTFKSTCNRKRRDVTSYGIFIYLKSTIVEALN